MHTGTQVGEVEPTLNYSRRIQRESPQRTAAWRVPEPHKKVMSLETTLSYDLETGVH